MKQLNLLFDLDGTLADPFVSIRASLLHAFSKHHLSPPSDALVRQCIGPPLHVSLRTLLHVPEEKAGEVLHDYRAHQASVGIHQYQIFPGALDTLKKLSGSHRMYVATSKPEFLARPVIEHLGLTPLFTRVYGSERDGSRAEKPELLHHLLGAEKLETGNTVMIGDRKHDVLGAKAHGLPCVGVLWGFGAPEELLNAGAQHLVNSWHELELLLSHTLAH